MKSSINLYSQDLRPRLEVLTLPFAMTMWLIVIILVVALGVFASVKEQQAVSDFERINQQKTQLEQQLRALSDALVERAPDGQLLNDIVEAELLLRNNSALLARLNDKRRLANYDYPALMQDLAVAHHQNVWLKRILVEGENVYLQGSSIQAKDIPVWISQLSETSFFSGVSFDTATFNQQSDDAQVIDFTLGVVPGSDTGARQ